MQNVEVLFYAMGGTAAVVLFVFQLISLAVSWLRDTPVPRPFNGMLPFAVKGFAGANREAPLRGPPRFHGLD